MPSLAQLHERGCRTAHYGSGRVFAFGQAEAPRKTFETPRFVHIEWPEHVARCVKAIRERWDREGATPTKDHP